MILPFLQRDHQAVNGCAGGCLEERRQLPPKGETPSQTNDVVRPSRYDTTINEFGIINQYGGISTYFRPIEGIAY